MKKLSFSKSLVFSLIIASGSIILWELTAHIVHLIGHGERYPMAAIQQRMQETAELSYSGKDQDEKNISDLDIGHNEFSNNSVKVIHPYIGFVCDPGHSANRSYLGFNNEHMDPLKTNSSRLQVWFVGGSFSAGVSVYGQHVIESILQKNGYECDVYCLALGGYKQPQQLMTVSYLISHGGHPDVIVNIDGFNEVALPVAENLPKDVNLFYPRSWYNFTAGMLDQAMIRDAGRLWVLQDQRRRWAALCLRFPNFSIIRNIVWTAIDNKKVMEIARLNNQVRKTENQESRSFLIHGPLMNFENEDSIFTELANHWMRCSEMLNSICQDQGIAYIHVLQPNQYFDSGRELTEFERKVCFRSDHPYRNGVVKGYPELLRREENLINNGITFLDLTGVFNDTGDDVYQDSCCHANPYGYEIVMEEIAIEILKKLEMN